MAEINLTQAEADALIAMEKHSATSDSFDFPTPGQSLCVQLQSPDKREQFFLDLNRGRINLSKVKIQNRARQVVVLARLDLGGAPHRNPDDVEIPAPHLHLYREGYGDKWAFPVPADRFRDTDDHWVAYEDFLRFCNITVPPLMDRGLLT